jgi:hypothetical protein
MEDADTVVIHRGLRQCRYPKPVAEVKGVDRAEWTCGGAIEFAAYECESRHCSQTSQQGAAADVGRHESSFRG